MTKHSQPRARWETFGLGEVLRSIMTSSIMPTNATTDGIRITNLRVRIVDSTPIHLQALLQTCFIGFHTAVHIGFVRRRCGGGMVNDPQ